MPSLRETLRATQEAFARALTGNADDFGAILEHLDGSTEAKQRRLAAYRRNVLGNRIGALRSTYPVVALHLGDVAFDHVARRYALLHPSHSGDLNEYGEDFAEVLRTNRETETGPWLADLACLEWQVQASYYAADIAPFDFAALAQVAPEDHVALRFRLAPSFRRIRSRWGLGAMWHGGQQSPAVAIAPSLDSAEQSVWVVRPQGRVWVETATPAEAALVDALARGSTLVAAIAAALAADAAFDIGAALQRCAALGILGGFSTAPASETNP